MSDPAKRLLLISHNFPPTLGPESVLVQLNARNLHASGWQVTPLATTMRHGWQMMDRGLLRALPADMRVLRAPSWDAYLATMIPRLGRMFNLWLEQRWLPEPYFLWRGPARRAGLHWLREHKPAVLYSRAQKFVSNVVGLDLKRATGLPWIAHFSDPWVEMIERQSHPRPIQMVHDLERAIMEEADAVVFVTRQTVEQVMQRYPERLREKVMVVPHGYDSATALKSNAPRGGPLRAVHAGAFYPGFREPTTLFKGIAQLHAKASLNGRFELVCIGSDTTMYQTLVDELGVRGVIQLRESVPFEACQQMLADAHLLVVVDTPNKGGIFLPTKVIEYFAHEKPVLGVADRGSAVEEALLRCAQPVAESSNLDDVERELVALLARHEAGALGVTEASREAMRGYEISRVNAPLLAKLDELWGRMAKGKGS